MELIRRLLDALLDPPPPPGPLLDADYELAALLWAGRSDVPWANLITLRRRVLARDAQRIRQALVLGGWRPPDTVAESDASVERMQALVQELVRERERMLRQDGPGR